MSERQKVARNAAWLIFYQITNLGAQLLVIPFLTRVLGRPEFGAVIAIIACTQFAFVITDYGFSLSATYAISRSENNKSKIQKVIDEVHSAKIILLIIAIIGLFFVSYLGEFREHRLAFMISILAIIAQAYQPVWFFQGVEDMRSYAIFMLWPKLIYLILIFTLVGDSGDEAIVILSFGVAQIVGMIIGLSKIKAMGFKPFKLTISGAIYALKVSTNFFWSRLAVSVYTSASSIVIGLVDLNQAALYGAAEQIYKAGQSVTGPINQALFPYIARTRRLSDLLKAVPVISVILIIGCLGVWLFSDYLVYIIYGQNYSDAKPILGVFLILVVVTYLNVSFGYPLFAGIGRPEIANYTVISASIVYAICLLALMIFDSVSAINMVVCVAITEVTVLLLRSGLGVIMINNSDSKNNN